ncbi:unnamed protein product [[Candida] boidinii]|nr:unnamed protein product [[Candida] boidinii]
MSAPLRNIARASRSKNILNSVRSYSTKEPTLKERFAEILPAKQEEVKKLKAEYGKTRSLKSLKSLESLKQQQQDILRL